MSRPHYELHLHNNPELPKKFGKRIRAIGGKYSECRAQHSPRFVHVPATKTGRELADQLLAAFPKGPSLGTKRAPGLSTVITRNFPRVDDLVVEAKSVAVVDAELRSTARKLLVAGKLPRPRTAAERAAAKLAAAVDTVERLRVALAKAEAELAALRATP